MTSARPFASTTDSASTWSGALLGYIRAQSPFTPVLGAARSLIALAALLTVAFTPTDQLFFRSTTFPAGVSCGSSASSASLFCIGAEAGQLELAKWVSLVVLAVVAAGIAPAFTALPHWWVTWSLMTSSTTVDGGDHLAADLTLILLPVVLLDRRRWHWAPDRRYRSRSRWVGLIAYSGTALVMLQMMGVYFQASVAKFSVLEWSDGTALWYWMQNSAFAPSGAVGDAVRALLGLLPITVVATYGTLSLQLGLVFAVFLRRRGRSVFLVLAVAFHLAIAILMGLWSFSMVMIAADLVLLLRPHEGSSIRVVLHQRPTHMRERGDAIKSL